MKGVVEEILEEYGLTRETTKQYIDAIIRLNQTETAEELQVSRDTINRYKKAFQKMTELERAYVTAALTQHKILQHKQKEDER